MVKRGPVLSESYFRSLWEDESLTQQGIATELGITSSAVAQRAKNRGLTPRRKIPTAMANIMNDKLFPELYLRGASRQELQRRYKCTSNTLTRVIRRMNLSRKISRWDGRKIVDILAEMAHNPSTTASSRGQKN